MTGATDSTTESQPVTAFSNKIGTIVPLQKLPKNVSNLGKLILAKDFKKLPKVQLIAQYGHTDCYPAIQTSRHPEWRTVFVDHQVWQKWPENYCLHIHWRHREQLRFVGNSVHLQWSPLNEVVIKIVVSMFKCSKGHLMVAFTLLLLTKLMEHYKRQRPRSY